MSSIAAAEWLATRDVLLEVYYSSDDPRGAMYISETERFAQRRPGIRVVARDLKGNDANADRLKKIADHFLFEASAGPVIYGCGQVIRTATDAGAVEEQLAGMLRFEVFVRDGCSRCAAAKEILPSFLKTYPGFELVYRSVNRDSNAVNEMNSLVRRYKASAASTPIMHFCNQIQIGFDRSTATTERLRKGLERWTLDTPPPPPVNDKIKVSEVTPRPPF